LKPAYTDAVSCREAEVDNSGFSSRDVILSVMRKNLATADAAVSRRENETRKVQLSLLWFACTSIGNGNEAQRAREIPSVAVIGREAIPLGEQ
jgi:hypothetical protein